MNIYDLEVRESASLFYDAVKTTECLVWRRETWKNGRKADFLSIEGPGVRRTIGIAQALPTHSCGRGSFIANLWLDQVGVVYETRPAFGDQPGTRKAARAALLAAFTVHTGAVAA